MNYKITLLLFITVAIFSCKKDSENTDEGNNCLMTEVSGNFDDDVNFKQNYTYNSKKLLSTIENKNEKWLMSYNNDNQLIKLEIEEIDYKTVYDISWSGNQVTEIIITSGVKNGTLYSSLDKPVYSNGKLVKLLRYDNPNFTTTPDYTDSLGYDLVGNITTFYTNIKTSNSSTTTARYDNNTFNFFTHSLNPFERPYLLFIINTPNNPVNVKQTGSQTWDGYNISYQLNSGNIQTKVTGTLESDPIDLNITSNCN
jgi:hypothetical protein